MRGTPDTWHKREAIAGGWILVGFLGRSMHVVAPPGIRIDPGEANEDRAAWRHAVWNGGGVNGHPMIAIDAPDEVHRMQTSDVVDLLPSAQHDFIRAAMARQLSWGYAVAHSSAGGCPEEKQARFDGRALLWLTRQLNDAFPTESWFRRSAVSIAIPDTADELLRRMPLRSDSGSRSKSPTLTQLFESLSEWAIAGGVRLRRESRWDLEIISVRCRRSALGIWARVPWSAGSVSNTIKSTPLDHSISRAAGN